MDSTSQNVVSNQKTDCKEVLSRKSKKKNKKRVKNRPDKFAVISSRSVDQTIPCNENTKHVDSQITFNVSNENCFSEDVTLTKKMKTELEEEEEEDTFEVFKNFHQMKKSKEEKPPQPPHVFSHDINSSSIVAKLKRMDKPTPSPQQTEKPKFPATPFGNKVPTRAPAFQNNTKKVTKPQNAENQRISKAGKSIPNVTPSTSEQFTVQSIYDAQNVTKPSSSKGHGKIEANVNPSTSNGKGRSKNKLLTRPDSGNLIEHFVTPALVDDQRDKPTNRSNQPGSKGVIMHTRCIIKKEPDTRLCDNISANTKNKDRNYNSQRNEEQNFDKKDKLSKTYEVNNGFCDTSNNQMTKESNSHQKNQQFSQDACSRLPISANYSQVTGLIRPSGDIGGQCVSSSKPSSSLESHSRNRGRARGQVPKLNSPLDIEQSYVPNSEPLPSTIPPPPGIGYLPNHTSYCPPSIGCYGPPPGFEGVTPTNLITFPSDFNPTPPDLNVIQTNAITCLSEFDPSVPPPSVGQNFEKQITPRNDENYEKSVNSDHSRSSRRSDCTRSKREDEDKFYDSEKLYSKGDGDRRRQNSRYDESEIKRKNHRYQSPRNNRRTNYGTQSSHHCNQDGDHTYKHDSRNIQRYHDKNRTHGNHSHEELAHHKRDHYSKSYNHENYNENQRPFDHRNDKREKYQKNGQRYDDKHGKSGKESQNECNSSNGISTNRSYKNRLPSYPKNEDNDHRNAAKCTCSVQQQHVPENWADEIIQEEMFSQTCDYCKTKSNESLCLGKTKLEDKHRSRSRSERDRSRSSNLSEKLDENSDDSILKRSTRKHKNKADYKNSNPKLDDTKNRKNNKSELFVPNANFYEPVIREIRGDLFQVSELYSLAHCVAADLKMGAGIAVRFRRMFRGVDDLYDQNKGVGEVAVLRRDNRYIFYLITKQYSHGKPTLESITQAIRSLKQCCEEYKVTKLAIPRIGCGLDRLDWNQVKEILFAMFRNTGVEILVHVQEYNSFHRNCHGVPKKG